MSPQLDSLLVWFLEFIRTGIFVYTGIAVLGALALALNHISKMDIGKNFLKLIPMFFFPMIFRQLIENSGVDIIQSQFIGLMKFMDVFYVLPVLLFTLMIAKEL